MQRSKLTLLFSVGALTLAPSLAQADALDGTWCADDGRTLSIDGPALVTPGGTQMTGDYARHTFAYVVPSGEPNAGSEVFMRQINDEIMELRPTPDAEFETWTRCDFTS